MTTANAAKSGSFKIGGDLPVRSPCSPLRIAVDSAETALFKLRNFVFFAAVIALNYTLSRPSPVEKIFILARVHARAEENEEGEKRASTARLETGHNCYIRVCVMSDAHLPPKFEDNTPCLT